MPHEKKKALGRADAAQKLRPARCRAIFAELSDYLDAQLDDSLCEELERHMNGCGPCQAFVATLEATIEQCRKSPGESPPTQSSSKLCKELMQNYQRLTAVLRPGS